LIAVTEAIPMHTTPKSVKRLVREWAAVLRNREIGHALLELRTHFDRWQRGEITALDLDDLIHQFHQGPSLEIANKYESKYLEAAIGLAIATGALRREEVPEALLNHVGRWVAFYESQNGDS
jgi:hypothetical protein